MYEAFTSDRVSSIVVERVPCVFSKHPSGKHFVTVMLAEDQTLIRATCECLEVNGPGIAAIHEMSGCDNSTCYSHVAAFHKSLRLRDKLDPGNVEERVHLPLTLETTLRTLTRNAFEKRQTRFRSRWYTVPLEERPVVEKHRMALQKVVDRVLAAKLGIVPSFTKSPWAEPKYPDRVLDVRICTLLEGDIPGFTPEPGVGYTTMGFHIVNSGKPGSVAELYEPMAVRVDGDWIINEDRIKDWARKHDQPTGLQIIVPGECFFCKESFIKNARHLSSAKHIDNVVGLFKLACRASSRSGLQFINNPRYRATFIPQETK